MWAQRQAAIDRFNAICAQMLKTMPKENRAAFKTTAEKLFADGRVTTHSIEYLCTLMNILTTSSTAFTDKFH